MLKKVVKIVNLEYVDDVVIIENLSQELKFTIIKFNKIPKIY